MRVPLRLYLKAHQRANLEIYMKARKKVHLRLKLRVYSSNNSAALEDALGDALVSEHDCTKQLNEKVNF